jgi:hypothetical protein
MNGRRDFGIAMAEYSDNRQQVREQNSNVGLYAFALCAFGVFAMLSGLVLIGCAAVGLALAISLANWR